MNIEAGGKEKLKLGTKQEERLKLSFKVTEVKICYTGLIPVTLYSY